MSADSGRSRLCEHDDCSGPPDPSQIVLLPGEDPEAEALRLHNMAYEAMTDDASIWLYSGRRWTSSAC